MCLVFFAWRAHPKYEVILLSNRDESYDRPTQTAHWWEDKPVFGGRDLLQKGTWLGVNAQGMIATVTNYRDPATPPPNNAHSRGNLPVDWLTSPDDPRCWLQQCATTAAQYTGYSLLGLTHTEAYYYSNRCADYQVLTPGIYGLSNALLDTSWPKLTSGKAAFARLVEQPEIDVDACVKIMEDDQLPPDHLLPTTGIPYAKEKSYGARFILTPNYGTRTTTLLLRTQENMVFFEKTHRPAPAAVLQQSFTLCHV